MISLNLLRRFLMLCGLLAVANLPLRGAVVLYTTEVSWLASGTVSAGTIASDSFEDYVGTNSTFQRVVGGVTVTFTRTDGTGLGFVSSGTYAGVTPADGSVQLGIPWQDEFTPSTWTMSFSEPVSAVSFSMGDLHDAEATATLTVEADSVLIWNTVGNFATSTGTLTETVSGASVTVGNGLNTFMGWTDPSGMSSLAFSVSAALIERVSLDNLQIVAVPEPANVGTGVLLLTLLVGVKRRRR